MHIIEARKHPGDGPLFPAVSVHLSLFRSLSLSLHLSFTHCGTSSLEQNGLLPRIEFDSVDRRCRGVSIATDGRPVMRQLSITTPSMAASRLCPVSGLRSRQEDSSSIARADVTGRRCRFISACFSIGRPVCVVVSSGSFLLTPTGRRRNFCPGRKMRENSRIDRRRGWRRSLQSLRRQCRRMHRFEFPASSRRSI